MAQKEDATQSLVNEISKALKGPLQEAIRRVDRLAEDFPSDKDFHFYNNFPHFNRPVRSIQSQVEALLTSVGLAKGLRTEPRAFPSDPDESYDWLVSLQDDLVEGVDAAVDKLNKETAAGKRGASNAGFETPKKVSVNDGSPSGSAKASRGSSERRPVPFHVRSIPRPQNKFEVSVDNSNTPFKHPQGAKSDAQKAGLSALDLHARKLGATFEDMHPLEDELTRMEYVEPKMLEEPVPQEPRPIAETPLTVVSTLLELNVMAAKCRLAGEIAVDLENHHYRSFQGFVCLMQVSTRMEDFIVDTLALRSHMSPCLKDIFADPRIIKVMHGADRDIVWLQRDFGIYVCNMFDTGQAARVLQLEGFGLAFLMQHFLKLNPDKRYQLADWRIRPLPAEMIKYAREDTHYLLYLYDLLRVQLVSMRSSAENDVEDPVLQVYKRSRDICLLMYKKDILTETSYLSLYGLQDRQLNPHQMSVLAGLYAWRDKLARKLDESTGFVLPNQLLYKLVEEMPDTARTLQNVIRGPHSLVGQHAAEVLEVIKQSKEKPVMSAPTYPSSWRIPVIDASDNVSSEMDTITTQAGKTALDVVSTDVPELLPAENEPVPEPNMEKEDSKTKTGETTIVKETTVGPSTNPQVMVKLSSVVEDLSPASTINIQRLNAAVVKRASVPSLALFGGGSKKKGTARNVGSSAAETKAVGSRTVETKAIESSTVETKPAETKPVEASAVGTSSRPGTASFMTDPEVAKPSSASSPASKLSIAVAEDIPEGVIVITCDGKGESSGGELIELEQESKSAAAIEAPSHDAGRLNEASGSDATPAPLSGSHISEDVAMVAAEENKASDIEAVNTITVVNSRKVSEVARPGLASMLGSSSHRKRQKRSNEDMEMVAAKLRAQRIQASVSLPFHRLPSQDEHEQDTEMTTSISTEPQETEPTTAQPSSQPASSGQEAAAPFEELGDYVNFGDMAERRSATKNSSEDLWSKEFATESKRPFPATLAQMRRKPKQGKHPAGSSAPKQEKQKPANNVESVNVESAVFQQPFDYEAARRDAGLGENLVSRKEDYDSGRGRGRGRPNKRQKQVAPPSTGGPVQPFDPLRRSRQEPRPDGIPAAKRRQVFPQTGNRTASFRR